MRAAASSSTCADDAMRLAALDGAGAWMAADRPRSRGTDCHASMPDAAFT
jgi:hypothetical protein